MSERPSNFRRQQTVKLAIDCETGELVAAETLHSMPEADFTAVRRAAMAARVERRRGGSAMRFRCALCEHPLYLSRHVDGLQNRWFVHDGKADHCPWYEGNHLAPDQIKALIYRGQQEGRAHRELKEFIANALAKDPQVSNISQEKTTVSQVLKGEWRRPDVKCEYRGMPLVFEIQLSYTFLSDVIARDEFYRRERIFIIWVFARFDPRRAAVTDEAFFNRRNLFVMDARGRSDTDELGQLTFSGYRQTPTLFGEHIRDVWQAAPVGLHQVTFPPGHGRPYFFDYEDERRRIESAKIESWRRVHEEAWARGIRDYLAAAMAYYDSDHAAAEEGALLAIVEAMYDNPVWHRGFETLRDKHFYGYHCVLPVLLSIQHARSVGYSKQLSAYQVIEAGLRSSGNHIHKHAFAILYLWAYKAYQPAVNEKQQRWLRDYAHAVKNSVDGGETTYRRFEGYDEAISLLFPELAEPLSTLFGTGRE